MRIGSTKTDEPWALLLASLQSAGKESLCAVRALAGGVNLPNERILEHDPPRVS